VTASEDYDMKEKLSVTDDGNIYVDGVLRLAGPPQSVLGNGDLQAHLLRFESEKLSPLDKIVHEKVMNAYGFHREQDGVWRQPR
jgi:hypothetical protein